MKISVVVPTYNRSKDLNDCLDSIISQEYLPVEVLVIDSGKDIQTENLIKEKESNFKKKGVILKYIKNNKENSLTVARNMGIENSTGEIVSFLDDDIVLIKDYYKETVKFFEENPKAFGMTGRTTSDLKGENKFKFFVAQILGRLFFLGFNEKNKWRVLPSLGVTSSLDNKIINCQWLSGASVYKKEIFKDFRYDEKLKKYSWGEDTDFSHRVFKKYPQSLFLNPKVRYIHNLSVTGRIPRKEISYMEEVYCLYLFYKIIPQTFLNRIIYIWGRLGRIIFKIIKLQFREIIFSFMAYFICLKHLKEIKNGDLDFFNKTLL
ncbi:MAG: hypothetical protein A2175_02270 [Candidatus Nealsonbacteria bacterium RBG_13_42_11]|uniref:Glycosyltransferase 2-like domain-containing protein n=1 Tax=Candidatus Nealsonbacteria bacterium RBG_13_42_11 TaxID=1801663 RepID=A0A1G2DZ98_9BACT|nr:MAG: hypothetical protein A2175_02270 [Candidatus Nealsonbacteria bacterium RBG_13_42_11]